jgi:hypothetical protein
MRCVRETCTLRRPNLGATSFLPSLICRNPDNGLRRVGVIKEEPNNLLGSGVEGSGYSHQRLSGFPAIPQTHRQEIAVRAMLPRSLVEFPCSNIFCNQADLIEIVAQVPSLPFGEMPFDTGLLRFHENAECYPFCVRFGQQVGWLRAVRAERI